MFRFKLPWQKEKEELLVTQEVNKDFDDIENLLVTLYDLARDSDCYEGGIIELRLLCKVFDLSERFLKGCIRYLNREIDDAIHKGRIVQEVKLLGAKYRLNALLIDFHETFSSKFSEWESGMASILPTAKAQGA